MPGDYGVLSAVYAETGMGDFARTMTPRLVTFAQRHDWLGRNILDLGCGTGESLSWLARHGYITWGVDNAPRMIELARHTFTEQGWHSNAYWLEQDIRSLDITSEIDLVLAINVLNELDSIRDLESVFRHVHTTLNTGKLFIFDLYTIEGLHARSTPTDHIAHDSDGLLLLHHNKFNFDRQSHTRRYTIFRRDSGCWERQEARRILRAYPVQAVTTLLQRSGFTVNHVLDTGLNDYTPGSSPTQRVIIMAEKQ